MAKIIGNTATTPMAVPDMAQTDERKADFVKNKKMSFLENDSGYVTEQYVNGVIVGGIGEAIEEIIKIQEAYIGVTITFSLNGNSYTCPKGMTWAELETYDGGAIWQAENLGKTDDAPIYLTSNGNVVTTIDSVAYSTRNTYISDVIRDASEQISYF